MLLVLALFVFGTGGAINNENLPDAEKVRDFKGLERSIERTVEQVKSRDKFVSFKLND